jgi:hypothetical protein
LGYSGIYAKGYVGIVIDQFLAHQMGRTGTAEQMRQAGFEFFTAGIFHNQAGADTTSQREQFIEA